VFEAVPSPYLVPMNGRFVLSDMPTSEPRGAPKKKALEESLAGHIERIGACQDVLYASDKHSVLLIFQAMDAAGKDGTIRAVMSGVNPAGCQVFSFKQPSKEELDHDFLWRTTRCLPERGRIGIFNRSYYEEVLVVRVHPELLSYQRLPWASDRDSIWDERLASMEAFEHHLARNGTLVLKFFLNVGRDEQKKRFLARIDDPAKNWKFASGDVEERGHWAAYQRAYQSALAATSKPWAPWYAIPADDKAFMRDTVADIVATSLESLGLTHPTLDEKESARLAEVRQRLMDEDP
jgi:PPK2 family polyphosphate:nucleotide phosphotransferase